MLIQAFEWDAIRGDRPADGTEEGGIALWATGTDVDSVKVMVVQLQGSRNIIVSRGPRSIIVGKSIVRGSPPSGVGRFWTFQYIRSVSFPFHIFIYINNIFS